MGRKYEIAVISKGAFARTVRIYSPKKSDRAVIMHDGQNAFCDGESSYGKSWRVLDTLKNLGIKNTAIIGIDSAATREDDYLPFPNELEKYGAAPYGGKADVYADYISTSVIPYLEKRFGYKLYGMLGSSAGALASLYYSSLGDKRIKAYGLFSTPLFVSGNAFDEFFKTAVFNCDDSFTVYTGGNEHTDEIDLPESVPDLFVSDAFKVVRGLRAKGVKDISLTVNNSGIHDETCWRKPSEEFFETFSRL